YERLGLSCSARPGLGVGTRLFAPITETEALRTAHQSNLVVLANPVLPKGFTWSFDRSMQQMTPQLRALCEREFIRRRTVRFIDTEVTLYVRPRLRVE